MNCGHLGRFAVRQASGCKSLMASQGCTHCGGNRVVGVGAGGRGLKAAAAGEEVYTEESRGERESHWVKETFYNL